MVKASDEASRISYSVRVKPDLIKRLKYLAVDENKPISLLIEEGIENVIESRKVKKSHK